MRKEFEFTVKGHKVKIVNSWFGGVKLYVDGDLRDKDSTFIANGKTVVDINLKRMPEEVVTDVSPMKLLLFVGADYHLTRLQRVSPGGQDFWVIEAFHLLPVYQVDAPLLRTRFYLLVIAGHNDIVLPSQVYHHIDIEPG